jgi:hypothetical protein
VECVEPEADRRTWTLWQDGRQVGHVRMRTEHYDHPIRRVVLRVYDQDLAEWTVEASRGIAREAIGLHDGDDAADRG